MTFYNPLFFNYPPFFNKQSTNNAKNVNFVNKTLCFYIIIKSSIITYGCSDKIYYVFILLIYLKRQLEYSNSNCLSSSYQIRFLYSEFHYHYRISERCLPLSNQYINKK